MKNKELEESLKLWQETISGVIDFLTQAYELIKVIILRKAVDVLKFIYDVFPFDFTLHLYFRYAKWFNARLVRNALNHDPSLADHYKVQVEEVETLGDYLIATVKYESITQKNISKYIIKKLVKGISAKKSDIRIHKLDDHRVKAIVG